MNYVLAGRTIGAVLARSQGAAFSPLSLSPALWLDASQLTGLSDGAAIATWTDASGNGRNATQASATKRPLYKTGIIGGKPVVRFDSDDFLSLSVSLASGSWSFFAVHSGPAIGSNGRYLLDAQTGRLIIAVRQATTANDPDIGWFDGNSRDIAVGTTGWQINDWILASGGNGTVYRNGTSLGSAAYTAQAIGGAVAIGGRYDGTSGAINCDIAEIIIYASALNTANRQAVDAYLSAKYGISLA